MKGPKRNDPSSIGHKRRKQRQFSPDAPRMSGPTSKERTTDIFKLRNSAPNLLSCDALSSNSIPFAILTSFKHDLNETLAVFHFEECENEVNRPFRRSWAFWQSLSTVLLEFRPYSPLDFGIIANTRSKKLLETQFTSLITEYTDSRRTCDEAQFSHRQASFSSTLKQD